MTKNTVVSSSPTTELLPVVTIELHCAMPRCTLSAALLSCCAALHSPKRGGGRLSLGGLGAAAAAGSSSVGGSDSVDDLGLMDPADFPGAAAQGASAAKRAAFLQGVCAVAVWDWSD